VFFPWLLAQRGRTDDVGRLALLVSGDRTYPRRSHRLYRLLNYCGTNPELRRLTKKAHAEWRVVRDGK
jgi:uncharacterized protein YozE (UPF0346 family)